MCAVLTRSCWPNSGVDGLMKNRHTNLIENDEPDVAQWGLLRPRLTEGADGLFGLPSLTHLDSASSLKQKEQPSAGERRQENVTRLTKKRIQNRESLVTTSAQSLSIFQNHDHSIKARLPKKNSRKLKNEFACCSPMLFAVLYSSSKCLQGICVHKLNGSAALFVFVYVCAQRCWGGVCPQEYIFAARVWRAMCAISNPLKIFCIWQDCVCVGA